MEKQLLLLESNAITIGCADVSRRRCRWKNQEWASLRARGEGANGGVRLNFTPSCAGTFRPPGISVSSFHCIAAHAAHFFALDSAWPAGNDRFERS